MAIIDADVTLMVVDAKAGVTPVDSFFANEIRKAGASVILLANKCEGKAGANGLAEAWSLGLGEPVPISATHGEGLVDLHDAMLAAAAAIGLDGVLTGETSTVNDGDVYTDVDHIEGEQDFEGQPIDIWQDAKAVQPMRIAIVGRPNMGKSTLINSLINEDRLLTGPESGITRDAIEVPFEWNGTPYKLVDTAGMRRRARISDKIEKLMVDDALTGYSICAPLCSSD